LGYPFRKTIPVSTAPLETGDWRFACRRTWQSEELAAGLERRTLLTSCHPWEQPGDPWAQTWPSPWASCLLSPS